jgi:endonuclease/exonuclease/phosphatase family metal-dependent hydrolase
LYADIKVLNDTIRVFNFHLQSLFFNQQDYRSLSDVKRGDVEKVLPGGKAILKKMKTAYTMRALQVNNILPEIESSPYRVIVCGDFNDVPASYTYQQLSHNLRDAQREAGTGIGRSFKFLSPTLRIDYILSDKRIMPVNAFTDHHSASDHFPFTAEFSIK